MAVEELHRIFQPAVAVHDFARRRALGAMRAAIDRRIPRRVPDQPTRRWTTSAATVQPTEQNVQMFFRIVTWRRGCRRTGFRLAHAGERQRAERGKAAGDQAGAAQESSAINVAQTVHAVPLRVACGRF